MNPRFEKVTVTEIERRHASWTFTGRVVKGDEIRYEVRDHNYHPGSKWEFVVHVPQDKNERIEVRPIKVPNIKILAQLLKRAITFQRATIPPHKARYYCKITLAVADGCQTKRVVPGCELTALLKVKWFKKLESRVCEKDAVTTTDGNDGSQLVILVEQDDYESMIRAFFATKVWVLRKRLNPYCLTLPK